MPAAAAGFVSEGFDAWNGAGGASSTSVGMAANWLFSGAFSFGLAAGRFGGQALDINYSGIGANPVARLPIANVSAVTISVAFQILDFDTSGSSLLALGLGGGIQVGVYFSGSGQIGLCNGIVPGTVFATSAPALVVANTWYYLELSVTVASGTGGSAAASLNGVNVVSASGINTAQSGAGADSVVLSAQNVALNAGHMQYDDLYWNPSATPLGPMRCPFIRAALDSAVAWTPNSGANNYSRVSETLIDGDTSFVSAAANGASDLYGYGSLPSTPGQIFAVSPVVAARTTDVAPRQIKLQVKSGATLDQGAAVVLTSTYTVNRRALLTDPNTSAAWTPAAVNSILAGPYLAA